MIKPTWRRHFRLRPFAKNAKERATHCVGNARKIKTPGHPAECLKTCGWDCAGTLVIHHNDAFRGDCAFRHFECRRDRAAGKPSFSTAQGYRNCLQPERIDQIMLDERRKEICASINWQIRPFRLLDFGVFFPQYLRLEARTAAIREKSWYSRRCTWSPC